MKAILISVKPELVAKILNGEKTIEIRKTAPKCALPIEVYIYCAEGREELYEAFKPLGEKAPYQTKPKNQHLTGGILKEGLHLNSKVVAKFTLRKVERLERYTGVYVPETILHTASIQTRSSMEKKSCLSMDEIWKYTNGNGYAWHISDLEIFDEPKELWEFKREIGRSEEVIAYKPITKAPQSWCYVEE